ncbi:MAG: glycoside hydrolase family 15 protein [Gemmatimonadales bacterium]|nr:glycoside hydrolase family 15 protein [Gemmatimonadales bacterium]
MTRHLPYAAYGNGQVLGLVGPDSAIDWLCLPRFDSPSVFGALLDAERGGTFKVLSRGRSVHGHLSYIRNTNVVRGEFRDGEAAWEIIDFAPRLPNGLALDCPVEIVRVIRPLAGTPRLSIELDPRPDYGRAAVRWIPEDRGTLLEWSGGTLDVAANLPLPYLTGRQEFALTRPVFVAIRYGRRMVRPVWADVQFQLDVTIAGWQRWAKTCGLPTFAGEAVLRSALCLKLHAYHDTGAIIAAATTSIPEEMGTERTWDYRFCWIRDAAFVAEALRRLAYLDEGERLLVFLRDVVENGPLQPLYGIGGERHLPEEYLDHWSGYRGNGHVRIGNAASLQAQHDLMGEVVLCMETLLSDPRIGHSDPKGFFPLVERMVEDAIRLAPVADTGIWEFRTSLKHHTFSRAMCWVAIHRGALLAARMGYDAVARRWEAIAERERAIVLERGYNPELGYFTQGLDGQYPDASNLLLPTLGIIDARDPRFVSTVDATGRMLTRKGLVYRYRNPDDFGLPSSTFTICSFWYAEALALVGRLEEAVEVFERLLSFANPVGLFSEDIDPDSGALLGNFPQAYTHVGLIHAAMTIGELLEARDGRVRAWV